MKETLLIEAHENRPVSVTLFVVINNFYIHLLSWKKHNVINVSHKALIVLTKSNGIPLHSSKQFQIRRLMIIAA